MADRVVMRWQQQRVAEALKTRRVVLLEGSRQSGKTTLAKILAGKDAAYRTLDNPILLQVAEEDPIGFVHHGDELMIIDEVQRVPNLLLAIKMNVDENPSWGRFLLTGSANIRSLPSVRESLAGRVSKIRLHPFAMGELKGNPPTFIAKAFQGQFQIDKEQMLKADYIRLAMRGGYPEVVKIAESPAVQKWHDDYLLSLLDHDLQDIVNIKDRVALLRLVEVLAAWSSKAINVSAIGSGLELSRSAIVAHINALEILYLIERVRPWRKTDYDRIQKQDKLFMADSGFMASILKWTHEGVCLSSDLSGKLIETFVFNQLSALLLAGEEDYHLFYYRDRDKREIDFIVENAAGALLAIEVKSGSMVDRAIFKHIKWFQKHMAKDRPCLGIVLYSGEHVLPFGKDCWAVPIRALWS